VKVYLNEIFLKKYFVGINMLVYSNKNKKLLAILLFVVGIILYHKTITFEFIFYDDPIYINNIIFNSNNVWGTLTWAFTDIVNANWSPLTILSLVIDFKIYGVNAGGYHSTNIILHCFNAILVFFILCRLLKNTRVSFLVALLFLIHPVNVEAVSWISERKGLLASFFTLISLVYFYKFKETHNKYFYSLSILFFFFGLMSKSVFVVLPLIFLLVSWYNFNYERFSYKKEIVVVLPFLILAFIFGLFTIYIHSKSGAVISDEFIPFYERLFNALNSYVIYLQQLFHPFNLSINYEYKLIPYTTTIINISVITLIFVIAYKFREKYKYVIFGLLWFTILLLPVLGFIQSGFTAHADRYLYLPGVGIYLIVVMFLNDFSKKSYVSPIMINIFYYLIITILMVVTWVQYDNWRTTVHLFEHAYSIDNNNYVANMNLANIYIIKGSYNRGLRHYEKAKSITPTHHAIYFLLSKNLVLAKKYDLALTILNDLLEIDNKNFKANLNVAKILIQQGNYNKAIDTLIKITPEQEKTSEITYFLALSYFKNSNYDKAIDTINSNVKIFNGLYSDKFNVLIENIKIKRNEK